VNADSKIAEGTTDNILVVSCSPNRLSVGRIVAESMRDVMLARIPSVELVDAGKLEPIWVRKQGDTNMSAGWRDLVKKVDRASGVVFVGPVYCYSAGSPLKIVTEIVGPELEWKPCAVLSAAGSERSHLAMGSLMLSLMFEQHTVVMPSTVVLTGSDVIDGDSLTIAAKERVSTFCEQFIKFTHRNARTPKEKMEEALEDSISVQ
jgi:NAD(P)H-dependent FMN reductase